MDREILNAIKERGLLLEKEVYELVDSFGNKTCAREFLEKIEQISGEKIITVNVLSKNFEKVMSFVGGLPGEEKNVIEKVFVKLGFSLEVRREKELVVEKMEERSRRNYQVICADAGGGRKLEVKDFIGHFRSRYVELQKILMQRQGLQKDLVSIGKISSDRQSLSVIGIVTEKRVTKNKNLIITFEDLTGEIKALIKHDMNDVFSVAEELQLDDVVGVRGGGNRDIFFVHELFFPDAFKIEKTKFDDDVCVAFLSDLHVGSNRHLGRSFKNFLDWIKSSNNTAKKVKYIFFLGDNVDGVGIFPNQEEVLNLKSTREQYDALVFYLKEIPKDKIMFMCPGQHDATRVAEPQPAISKKYAPTLYEFENLVLTTNPAMVKLTEGNKEFKILMYHGASLHAFINEIKELREIKGHVCPARAVKHMLKRRHLAPMHGDVAYIPNPETDPMVISEVPDVICTGEVHRLDIENYNGILIIAGSCWQAQTPFEEKVGNVPDPCKVPILNLKTRELKIFDFTDEEEVNDGGVWRGG